MAESSWMEKAMVRVALKYGADKTWFRSRAMSSTAASGRRRTTDRHYSAEEQALDQISREAEARIQQRRQARAEARDIRMREIERQQKEEEEKLKSQPTDSVDASRSTISSYTTGSRRGSEESTDTDISSKDGRDAKDYNRELRAQLRELEDKYKKAMMTNAQLDNVKTTLVFQTELLKDQMEEQEEGMIELQREYKKKCQDYENQKRDFNNLDFEHKGLKEQMAIKDKLLQESGLMIVASEEGVFSLSKCSDMIDGPVLGSAGAAIISQESAEFLQKAGEGSLDDKLKKLIEQEKQMQDEIKNLTTQLEEERQRREAPSPKLKEVNGPEQQLYEVQREASKQIHEYKLKLQKAEQDIATLEGTVYRLETQVKRFKYDAEEAEKLEDELKTDRRRLQRELRECQNQIEEVQNQNKHLNKRLEKIRQSRKDLVN